MQCVCPNVLLSLAQNLILIRNIKEIIANTQKPRGDNNKPTSLKLT